MREIVIQIPPSQPNFTLDIKFVTEHNQWVLITKRKQLSEAFLVLLKNYKENSTVVKCCMKFIDEQIEKKELLSIERIKALRCLGSIGKKKERIVAR